MKCSNIYTLFILRDLLIKPKNDDHYILYKKSVMRLSDPSRSEVTRNTVLTLGYVFWLSVHNLEKYYLRKINLKYIFLLKYSQYTSLESFNLLQWILQTKPRKNTGELLDNKSIFSGIKRKTLVFLCKYCFFNMNIYI